MACKELTSRRRLSSLSSDSGAGFGEGATVPTSAAAAPATREKTKQESVWKIEQTSTLGCTFICPQLQSFNTSLRGGAFEGATAVIQHRVTVATADDSLKATVSLNNNPAAGRNCPEFEKSKQVGPMLDWAASLRYCVGYADRLLLDSARYLLSKSGLFAPQIRKVLGMIAVDENFCYRRASGVNGRGTLRASSCNYVADDTTHRAANLCSQCRLLQEPLDILGLWK